MKDTIIGTIVEAGTDQRDGICRLIIETEESELKQLKDLPLFAPGFDSDSTNSKQTNGGDKWLRKNRR